MMEPPKYKRVGFMTGFYMCLIFGFFMKDIFPNITISEYIGLIILVGGGLGIICCLVDYFLYWRK